MKFHCNIALVSGQTIDAVVEAPDSNAALLIMEGMYPAPSRIVGYPYHNMMDD